jgi:glycosyltransferase involved in cell wall biosynthesis
LNVFVQNGFTPDQTHLLPFAVENDHPRPRIERGHARHPRFLFVGRLQPYKGAHLLVEAFNALASPGDATLTIYGGPDGYPAYYDRLQALIASNERIRFAGTIEPAALGDAFACADVFVLPSIWHENSPLILLDALQSRTPVIASDVGGITDMIDHGVNGLLFPMGDRDALQALLQQVIDQPEMLERLRPEMNLPSIDTYAATVIDLSLARVGRASRSELAADRQRREWSR